MKSLMLALAMVALATVLSPDCFAQTASPAPAGVPVNRPAEQVYTNIKALIGVPYGELIPGMQVMSEALGVDCVHCHSESGDRDVEGNPNKDIARDMIRMVRDLNQRNFGGRNVISCYTCHRGSTQPVANPSLVRAGDSTILSTSQDGLPSLSQVIDKYVTSQGGARAVRERASRVEEGMLTIRSNKNQQIPIQVFSQAPDKRLTKGFTVSHLGNSAQAFGVVNGTQGWMRESNGPVRLMFGWRRDAAQLEDLLNLAGRVEQLLHNLRVARRERIAENDAWVISGNTEYLPLVELFFDAETGVLLRTVYYVESVVGRMPSRIDYSNFRAVDGAQVPFQWEVTLLRDVRIGYQLNRVKHELEIDPVQFQLPNPAPSLYR